MDDEIALQASGIQINGAIAARVRGRAGRIARWLAKTRQHWSAAMRACETRQNSRLKTVDDRPDDDQERAYDADPRGQALPAECPLVAQMMIMHR